jgi:hypothetical protein
MLEVLSMPFIHAQFHLLLLIVHRVSVSGCLLQPATQLDVHHVIYFYTTTAQPYDKLAAAAALALLPK